MVTRGTVVQGLFARSAGSASATGKGIQRKSAVQLRAGVDAFPVELRQKTGGWPLPREIQSKMETALGANFSDVRIHVGPEAASIGAIAFTWGSDIHFAPGQYNPHTPQGQMLLGHELTHVVQQRAGRVANPFGSGVAVVQDHALEAEADRLGRIAATSTAHLQAKPAPGMTPGAAGVINRKVAPAYAMRAPLRNNSGWQISVAVQGKPQTVGSVNLSASDHGVFISDLQVDSEHRRHGLATELISAAMRTARSNGYSVAQLEARPDSPADIASSSLVSMYRRLGFHTSGISRRGNPLMERRTS
jgi:ribosomal protein S18 acetylase RimI-like enzyme